MYKPLSSGKGSQVGLNPLTPLRNSNSLSLWNTLLPSCWLQTTDYKLVLPSSVQKVFKTLHQTFHLGIENAYQLARNLFNGKGLLKTVSQLLRDVRYVKRTSQRTTSQRPPGLQHTGKYPGEEWQTDLTHRPVKRTSVSVSVGR